MNIRTNIKKSAAFMMSIAVICTGFALSVRSYVPKETSSNYTAYAAENTNAPVVYQTSDISAEGLVKVYKQLGFDAEGNVAVKMSTGEPPNSNYLRPELIKDLVQSVNGTIVECNTAYGGSRSSTAMHRQVIEEHGFNDIANVDIMDEEGSMTIPISKGNNIKVDYVGTHLANYNSLISLAHFKGHAMAGFGGAIKNMSIGVASREGKCWIHTSGNSRTSPWGGNQDRFLESMGEATSGVVDYFNGKVVYINVMNNISIDCDCDGNPSQPDMHDVGILASTDPVALDQACIDIVYNTDRTQSGTLINRIESRNGLLTLEYAEQIGLGSRSYNLVNIDENSGIVTMEYNNRAVEITNLDGAAKLIHVSYNNDALDGVEIINAENGIIPINAKPGDRILLWSSLEKMQPLCESIEITE